MQPTFSTRSSQISGSGAAAWMRVFAIAGRTARFAAVAASGFVFYRSFVGRSAALSFVGQQLRQCLQALGPSFIKIGQFLAMRQDLLPGEMLAPLRDLHERIAPVPFQAIVTVLEESYGVPCDRLFSTIDRQPAGCGAIAQVHRAITVGGAEVALKVLKPGVCALLEIDLQILRSAVSALARWPIMREMPLCELVDEIASILAAQLDFRREAMANHAFRTNFRYVDDVEFPRLVEDLCTSDVLAMEYLAPLTNLDHPAIEPAHGRRLALAGLRALYRMIFDHGLVHADMHPGNVFRSASGRLAILDTGLVAQISGETQKDFVDFFFSLITDQGIACAELVWRMAISRGDDGLRPAFDQAMIGLVARHSSKRSGEFEITTFVHELLEVQRRHRVRASPQFISLVLAMTIYDGLCRVLYPGCDFQGEARGYLIAARYRRQPAQWARIA